MSRSPSQDVVNILKRRCEALEEELVVAKTPKPLAKNIVQTQIYAGRPIRRLVSFFDGAHELVEENDRRSLLELEGFELEEGEENNNRNDHTHTIEQERLFRGYQSLIRYVPLVKATLDRTSELRPEELSSFYKHIAKGSDMARSDDTASLKIAIVEWIHDLFGHTDQRLDSKHKFGRGLNHDHCGLLLCPVEFDWSDLRIRAKIRDGHPEYAVTAHSWPTFIYAGFETHPDDMECGIFRSLLLVKAYKHIFTSPMSVTQTDDETGSEARASKRCKTGNAGSRKSNIATLMNLQQVTPRSIAYITVQVRFALSSLNAWNEVDVDFNHRDFYNAIVDFFENSPGPVAQRGIIDLLQWWNRKVFGKIIQKAGTAATPNSSITRLTAQRAAKEAQGSNEVEENDDSLEDLYA